MSEAVRANLEKVRPLQDSQSKSGKGIDKSRRKKQSLTPDMARGLVKAVRVSEDGNEVKIILAVDPSQLSTAQEKGVFVDKSGRPHFFTKPKQRREEQTYQAALAPYAHHTQKWGEVPVELDVKFFFSYPTSTPKKHLHKIAPHNTRPDGDNLLKNLADALTKVNFWKDDSFINTYHIYKRRTSESACIVIKITNLQPKFEALFRDTENYDNPTLFNQNQAKPAETNPLSDLQAESPPPTL